MAKQPDVTTRSIANAADMLAFSARRGIKLKDDDVAAVIVARRAGKSMNEDQEQKFWSAYSDVAAAVLPATSESVSAASLEGRDSPAMQAAAQYRVRTIVTLVALLLGQIYWLIGATVVTDLKEIRTRLEALSVESEEGKRTEDSLPKPDSPEYQAKKLEFDLNSRKFDDKLWIEKVSAATDFEVLANWNFFRFIIFREAQSEPPPIANPPDVYANQESTNQDSSNEEEIKSDDYFLWVFTKSNVIELQTSQIILTSMIKYILPILYGALGASAYIVRLLADEIMMSTYSNATRIRYQLRFYLGAVAGFSIAWFTSAPSAAESTGILQSLSPLALAFLAGYSVDLLFSVLDRLVSALSDSNPRRNQAQGGRNT